MSYRRARRAAWRTIAGETVLLDLERKRMVGLNPAAAAVWQAMDSASGPGELLRVAAGAGEPSFGEPEIAAFLDQLLALGLVEERPPGPSAVPEEGEASLEAAGASEKLEPPAILWREDVEQIAGSCAMFPSTNPICDQAPFS